MEIAVHQMGKVASKSIQKALEDHGIDVTHFHMASRYSINSLAHQLKLVQQITKHAKYCAHRENSLKTHIVETKLRHKRYKKSKKEFPFRTITLIRDPIARALSDFAIITGQFKEHFSRLREDKTELIDKLIRKATALYPNRVSKCGSINRYLIDYMVYTLQLPEMFFKREFANIHQINVFSLPRFEDYYIWHGNQKPILIIKYEKLGQCCQAAFKDFLGIEDFQLPQVNITKNSISMTKRKIYTHIKNTKFPESFIDQIYNKKWVRHFYSRSEIEAFREKWTQ